MNAPPPPSSMDEMTINLPPGTVARWVLFEEPPPGARVDPTGRRVAWSSFARSVWIGQGELFTGVTIACATVSPSSCPRGHVVGLEVRGPRGCEYFVFQD